MEFIGREKEMKGALGKRVFFAPKGAESYASFSLSGPNGIGKTRLITELSKRLEEKKKAGEPGFENVFHVPMTIGAGTSAKMTYYWFFWKSFFETLSRVDGLYEAIEKNKDKNGNRYGKIKESIAYFDNEENTFDDDHAAEYLDHFFDDLKKLDIRLIVTIDEFDKLKGILENRGEDGAIFNKLYSFSAKAGADNICSFLPIARRNVGTVAFGMDGGSNFVDAYPPIPSFGGFRDSDMEIYFDHYDGENAVELTEEQKDLILLYCGRHPGMLTKLYDDIELEEEMSDELLYDMIKNVIREPYERMMKLMKEEFVDAHKSENFLNKYIQAFIGPVVDSKEIMDDAVGMMQKYGFITKTSEKQGYSSIEKLFDDEWELDHEPIAPFFVEYIRTKAMPEDKRYLDQLLEKTELLVREVIQKNLISKYGDSWKDHVDDELPFEYKNGVISGKKKDAYYQKLEQTVAENHAEERGIVFSKLDVLAFHEYYRFFIAKDWDSYRPYFPDYTEKDDLGADFQLVNDLRNPFAHRNARVFSQAEIEKGQAVCKKLIEGMEKN